MRRIYNRPGKFILAALVVLGQTGFGAATLAQPLSVEEAADYLGTWNLAATFQETPVELVLEIVVEEGEVRAALGGAFSPEAQLMDAVTKTTDGVTLGYDADFGSNSIRIEITASLEGDRLVGSLGAGSLFTADFVGAKAAEVAGLVADATAAAAEDAQAPGRRRRGSAQVKLTLDEETEIRISHGRMQLDSPDHRTLLATAVGEVWSYGSSRTMKLRTDVDLLFGETRVPTHNFAPNYPGTYALWLKRVGDGWHLVFNEQADVWGTQYDSDADVAEVPLEVTELETVQEELLVELTEKEGGGTLRIVWGNRAWSAPFQVE